MYARGGDLLGLLLRIPALAVVTVFVGALAFLAAGAGQLKGVEGLLTFAFVTTDERVYTDAYPIVAKDGEYIGSVFIEPEQVSQAKKLKLSQLNEMVVNGWEVGTFLPLSLTSGNEETSLLVDQAKKKTMSVLGLEPVSLVTRTPHAQVSSRAMSAIQRNFETWLPRVEEVSIALNALPIEKYHLKYVDGDQLMLTQIEDSLRKARESRAWIIIEFTQMGTQTNQKLREIIQVAKVLGFRKFVLQQR
ncbi:hypothetical protein HYR54_02550 [Candidatus Acetothermia bacterium]|nr:hypothetical protein [Candidatus Acetothermia bacterium]